VTYKLYFEFIKTAIKVNKAMDSGPYLKEHVCCCVSCCLCWWYQTLFLNWRYRNLSL